MSWARGIGPDGREIRYAVAARCDHPLCQKEIDRGLAYVCGPMHGHCEWGCGNYYCETHRAQANHGCPGPAAPGRLPRAGCPGPAESRHLQEGEDGPETATKD